MTDPQWREIAGESNLTEGVPLTLKTGEEEILLARIRGRIYACGPKCNHYGAPLSDGVLSDRIITCPWHSARFNVTNGKLDAAPALDDLPCYPVKVENGRVFVGIAARPAIPRPSGEDHRTFAIIGAGAAGNAAAEMLRREGFAGRILLVTAEEDGPYDRPNLSKEFLAGKAPAEWIPLRSKEFYSDHGIELLTNHRVTELNPVDRTITFENGKRVGFDRALLATGGTPRNLAIPGADLNGVFVLRSLADARALLAALKEAESAVVLGAGFIGMEVAASLREQNLEVHVVAPEKTPMEKVFGDRIGKWIQGLHERNGVHFHLETTAKEIQGDKRVQKVVLTDGTQIKADLVVVGVGVVPAIRYLQGTGLVASGAVPVDDRLETKVEGIFAAGDIALVPDGRTGELQRVEHWWVAENQGRHAARAMLGREEMYDETPFFWTRQCGKSIQYCGFAPRFDRIDYEGAVEDGKFLARYYADEDLKAAAAVGRPKEIIAIARELRGQS